MAPSKDFASLYDELEWRGILYQVTDPSLKDRMKSPMTFYVGFDPTSDSLHLGSLLPVVTMKRFQQAGHRPLFLVGGATGLIGDPSGKTQERVLLTPETVQTNINGIRKVAERFLDFSGPHATKIVNNIDWIGGMGAIAFLRDVGKHFTVNMMLGKDSVKGRLESRDHGISYTEFSYMILQSYDFYHLQKTENCHLQMGGSDQWGNITAGIDLIRRMNAAEGEEVAHAHVFGLTWPLVTKSDGTKFGKSEAGNVWLDGVRTTAYQFYQYLLQTPDSDVIRFLKLFSFKSKAEIEALEKQVQTDPAARAAQKELARELTELVHGKAEVQGVEAASGALFGGGDLSGMSLSALKTAFAEAPATKKERLSGEVPLIDLLVETGLCSSKGAARKDLEGGGIYLNQVRVEDVKKVIQTTDLLHGQMVVLRKGKKNYHLVFFG
ncbi:MAG: tyrosine--tRNA ligase [Bdellovibrionales bacterium]|nr:tyrosine--tRNA ligase [Bdellovibrionales bacterium]